MAFVYERREAADGLTVEIAESKREDCRTVARIILGDYADSLTIPVGPTTAADLEKLADALRDLAQILPDYQ